MTIIRLAAVADVPSLLPLIAQLGYPLGQSQLEQRFERFISHKGYGVAVAVSESNLVGWIAWSKSFLFVSDMVRFHIEGLVVDENHRGKGIGKKLISFVETIAMDHMPAIVDLVSGVRRAKDGTHDFYKNLGYQNEGHMAKLYLRKEI